MSDMVKLRTGTQTTSTSTLHCAINLLLFDQTEPRTDFKHVPDVVESN